MPIVNVKSPEIAKLDQQEEAQRQYRAWREIAELDYNSWLTAQLKADPELPKMHIEQVAILLGALIVLCACLRLAFFLAGVF